MDGASLALLIASASRASCSSWVGSARLRPVPMEVAHTHTQSHKTPSSAGGGSYSIQYALSNRRIRPPCFAQYISRKVLERRVPHQPMPNHTSLPSPVPLFPPLSSADSCQSSAWPCRLPVTCRHRCASRGSVLRLSMSFMSSSAS